MTAPLPSESVADRWLAGFVFGLSVVAFIALEALERDTGNLLLLVGPVVAALLVNGKINNVAKQTEQQNKSLAVIERNTNGVLDERIRSGTLQAMQDAGLVAVPAGTPVPIEPVNPPAAAPPAV